MAALRNAPNRNGSQTISISPQSAQQSLPSILARQAHIRNELTRIRSDKALATRPQRYMIDSAKKLFETLGDKTIVDAMAGVTILELALKSIQSGIQEEGVKEIRNTFEALYDEDNRSHDTILNGLTKYSSILNPAPSASSVPDAKMSKGIDAMQSQLNNIKGDKKRPRSHRDLAGSAINLANTIGKTVASDPGTTQKVLSLALKAIQHNAQVHDIRDVLEDLLDAQANAAAINAELEAFSGILHAKDASERSLPAVSGNSRVAAPPPPYQSASTTRKGAILREFTGGSRIIRKDADEQYTYRHEITLGANRAMLPDMDFSITDRQTGGTYESYGKVNEVFGHKFDFQ